MTEKNTSLEKALRLLDLFMDEPALSMNEIVERSAYSKSSVQRLLKTLTDTGYLYKGSRGAKYTIGLKVYELARRSDIMVHLAEKVDQPIEDLSRELGLTVSAYILDSKGMLATVTRSSVNNVKGLIPNLGDRNVPYASSGGKCLLAFDRRYPANLEHLKMVPFTDRTIKTSTQLRQELDEVRKQGYAMDDEELTEGLSCYAMPVLDHTGTAICAISVSGYKVRIYQEKERILDGLRKTVGKIQKNL